MHFGSVGVSPEVVAIFLVKPMSMLNARWYPNPVLESGFADA